MGFKGAYFSSFVKEGRFSADQVFFEIGLNQSILSLYNLILDEVKTQRPLYQMRACAAILSLIAEVLARERRKEQPNLYQQTVEKAKYFMETNILGAIDLPSIAEQLGFSTSRLNEIFKT